MHGQRSDETKERSNEAEGQQRQTGLCRQRRLWGRCEIVAGAEEKGAVAAGGRKSTGEAMGFLAELAWNADAVINAIGLTWRQVDDLTVEVSIETRRGAGKPAVRR